MASQAAQMSFAAANHQGHNGMDHGVRATGNKNRIRDVWASNLSEEMAILRCLVDKYPYIAMVRSEIIRQVPDVSDTVRTPNFLDSSHALWALSMGRAIIIISVCDVMLICSRYSN